MSTQVSMAQAQAEFAALISRAEAGEEIIITRNGKPVVRLSALPMAPVGYGDLAGLRIGDDVSLSDDVLDDFLAR